MRLTDSQRQMLNASIPRGYRLIGAGDFSTAKALARRGLIEIRDVEDDGRYAWPTEAGKLAAK